MRRGAGDGSSGRRHGWWRADAMCPFGGACVRASEDVSPLSLQPPQEVLMSPTMAHAVVVPRALLARLVRLCPEAGRVHSPRRRSTALVRAPGAGGTPPASSAPGASTSPRARRSQTSPGSATTARSASSRASAGKYGQALTFKGTSALVRHGRRRAVAAPDDGRDRSRPGSSRPRRRAGAPWCSRSGRTSSATASTRPTSQHRPSGHVFTTRDTAVAGSLRAGAEHVDAPRLHLGRHHADALRQRQEGRAAPAADGHGRELEQAAAHRRQRASGASSSRARSTTCGSTTAR